MVKPSDIQLNYCDVLQVMQRYYREPNEKNLEIVSFDLKPFSDSTQGFLSLHRFLHVFVKHKTTGEVKEEKLQFFAKLAPSHSAALSEYVEDFKAFAKEANFYRLLVPHLQKINLPNEFAANCLMARNDILVFENLAEKKFRLGATAGTILDYDHLKVALKTLANLHSASLILESRTSKSLRSVYPNCFEENAYPILNHKNLRVEYLKLAIKSVTNLVSLIPKYSQSSELVTIQNKFKDTLEKIFTFVTPSDQYRNIVCHGDLWANNLLFRYDEKTNRPMDCRLVDFQLARYAPAMLDVMTILTIPTTSTFRRKHLNNLIEEYYTYLRDFLANHNISIEDELPRNELQASAEYFKLAGLIESCLFSHITLLPTEVANGLSRSSEDFQQFLSPRRISMCAKAFQSDSIYRERLTDMICEIIDDFIL